MRLELGKILINDVKFCSETKVDKGVLYINKEELISHLMDDT